LAAFGLFCAALQRDYLVNDVLDIKVDRQHPVKKFRPIPLDSSRSLCSDALIAFNLIVCLVGYLVLGRVFLLICLVLLGYELCIRRSSSTS
jgi:4-hydroxybenzoate polyprenyltransferase